MKHHGFIYTIKPIPTRYKGIEYRSKLEAEWAQWLDESGVHFAYEPKIYRIKSSHKSRRPIRYLPDFLIFGGQEILEVKPRTYQPKRHPLYRMAQRQALRRLPSSTQWFIHRWTLVAGSPGGNPTIHQIVGHPTVCLAEDTYHVRILLPAHRR